MSLASPALPKENRVMRSREGKVSLKKVAAEGLEEARYDSKEQKTTK